MILAGAGGASLEGEGPAAAERGGLRPEDGRDGAGRGGAGQGGDGPLMLWREARES